MTPDFIRSTPPANPPYETDKGFLAKSREIRQVGDRFFVQKEGQKIEVEITEVVEDYSYLDWLSRYDRKPDKRNVYRVKPVDTLNIESDLERRAQTDNVRLFVENLANLRSSIADILREDEQYLEEDINKLLRNHATMVRQQPMIKELGLRESLKGMLELLRLDFADPIEKYKRFNHYYNMKVVDSIKQNQHMFGIRFDPNLLAAEDQTSLMRPQTMKIDPKIPSYLKKLKVPEISKEKPSRSWHSKLESADEMLKVLGRYVPILEESLEFAGLAEEDTRTVLDLRDDKMVMAHMPQSNNFYEIVVQTASRMATSKLMAVKGLGHIYALEEIPKFYPFDATDNRDILDAMFTAYMKTGGADAMKKRMDQWYKDRTALRKKTRQVYQQWVALYRDTAEKVGVSAVEPIEIQLVRYGQQIVSDTDIVRQAQELDKAWEKSNEELHDIVTDLAAVRYAVQGAIRHKEGGDIEEFERAAQLREPTAPVTRVDIPEAPTAPEAPETPVAPGGEPAAKPPKLPVSEEFLPLLYDEDMHMYFSVDGKLTAPQAIAMAGRNEMMIAMQYQKASQTGDPEEGVTKNYVLEPYSYRFKNTKLRGRRKYLFAFDRIDDTIKAFLVKNIKQVQILPEYFAPRWEVEFY